MPTRSWSEETLPQTLPEITGGKLGNEFEVLQICWWDL